MVILYHALLSTSDKNYPYLKELISVCVCVGRGRWEREYRQANNVTTLCSKYSCRRKHRCWRHRERAGRSEGNGRRVLGKAFERSWEHNWIRTTTSIQRSGEATCQRQRSMVLWGSREVVSTTIWYRQRYIERLNGKEPFTMTLNFIEYYITMSAWFPSVYPLLASGCQMIGPQ